MKRFLVACVLVCFGTQGALAAPVQWPASEGGNDHYYEVVNTSSHWLIALAFSLRWTHAGLDGHLATLTSAEEDAWVLENVLRPQGIIGRDYHIGGWNADMYGNPRGLTGWQWLTGQPWEYEGWAPGEPNNAGGQGDREKCLAYHYYYYHGGVGLLGWNDVSTDSYYGFIVEYDDEEASNVPTEVPVPVQLSSWGRVKVLYH